jgi:hypothetical protein
VSDANDDAWLAARERGDSVDHVPAETRQRYRNLERHVAELPGERAPEGWQARVLAKLDATAPRRRWPIWVAAGGLAAAAAIVLVLVMRGGSPGERDLVVIDVREPSHSATTTRSAGTAAVGDMLVAHATGAHLVELRAYRKTGPAIARCPGGPSCGADGSIELVLDARGPIRVVAFYDHEPPPPTTDRDADIAAASKAGTRIATAAPLDVQ